MTQPRVVRLPAAPERAPDAVGAVAARPLSVVVVAAATVGQVKF